MKKMFERCVEGMLNQEFAFKFPTMVVLLLAIIVLMCLKITLVETGFTVAIIIIAICMLATVDTSVNTGGV